MQSISQSEVTFKIRKMMQKKNRSREKQNLEMKITFKIHAMKYFTLNGSRLQSCSQVSEEQEGKTIF